MRYEVRIEATVEVNTDEGPVEAKRLAHRQMWDSELEYLDVLAVYDEDGMEVG